MTRLASEGVIAVIAAEISAGELVERSVASQVQSLTRAGVSGLAIGLASEADRMTNRQRLRLLRAVRDVTELPIVCGVYGNPDELQAAFAPAVSAGATALMLSASAEVDEAQLTQLVAAARAEARHVVLQEPIGARLPSVEALARLRQYGLTHVKFEAKRSGSSIADLSRADPELGVIAGWGGFDYPSLFRCGARWCMPAADLAPLMVSIHRALVDEQIGRAIELYEKTLPLLAYVGQDLDLIIAAEKFRLRTLGLLESIETLGVRSPLSPLEVEELERLWSVLDAGGEFDRPVGIPSNPR